jgi:hypothetical protein
MIYLSGAHGRQNHFAKAIVVNIRENDSLQPAPQRKKKEKRRGTQLLIETTQLLQKIRSKGVPGQGKED